MFVVVYNIFSAAEARKRYQKPWMGVTGDYKQPDVILGNRT